jgi:hypothetical protein
VVGLSRFLEWAFIAIAIDLVIKARAGDAKDKCWSWQEKDGNTIHKKERVTLRMSSRERAAFLLEVLSC